MITIESVTRTYGAFTAVDDVSITARPDRVTGFLGPNGAGKSATIPIIVGLTRATSGTATISGRRYVDLPNPGLEVGVLLDASAQYAGCGGCATTPWACGQRLGIATALIGRDVLILDVLDVSRAVCVATPANEPDARTRAGGRTSGGAVAFDLFQRR